jgi:hypothetical protein
MNPPSQFSRLASAALLLCTAAHAQQMRERIEVPGHYVNGVGTTDAASEGAVTARLIENRPLLRPAEVLEFVPGVVVTQHRGGGKANQYFLRGFNLDHGTDFATWVGGMPVNMPSHAHGQGYSDLNFLIPEVIARIDYAKGPYFASQGDFSSAGNARIALADRLERNLAELRVGGNGFGRMLAAGSTATGAGNLLAAIELARNDGPWQHPEDLRRWSGMARLSRGDAAEGWSVTAMGYGSRWNATDQVPRRALDAGLIERFGTLDATDGGDTARYSLSFESRLRGTHGTTEASAYAIRSRLDLYSNFTYVLDDPEAADQFEQAEQRTVVGGRLQHRWDGTLLGRGLSQRAGVEVRHDRVSPVGLYRTAARERLATTREDRVRQGAAGAFYEATLRLSDLLRSTAGVRYDRHRFQVASDDPVNGGARGAGVLSPKLATAWTLAPSAEVFANWGRGFHSNDARGATIARDPRTGEAVDRVTPLARSTGSELGLRLEPVARLQSSLAVWQLRLASELLFVGDAGTTEASRPSRRRGAEWNNHYATAGGVLLDLDASWSRARFADDDPAGNRIPGAVERVVSAAVTLDDGGPWSASLQLRHFGARALVEDGSVRSRPTTLAYARVGYRFDRTWSASLDAFNLFDRKASDIDYYYASRLRGEPADGIADVHFHPVEPRTLRLSIRASF